MALVRTVFVVPAHVLLPTSPNTWSSLSPPPPLRYVVAIKMATGAILLAGVDRIYKAKRGNSEELS